ncbi:MAG: hypothetical protein ACLU9S_11975 [Oscillospiraceae bacterium]
MEYPSAGGKLVAAILGLFPNCAASVLLTDLYVHGVMGPGPMLAGLLVNAGVDFWCSSGSTGTGEKTG